MIQGFKQIIHEYGGRNTILVYQMGKVGSTSLEKSLKDVRHFHTLYSNPPCYIQKKGYKNKPIKWTLQLFGSLLKRILIRRRKKVKIISLVREPYGRNTSMFFQDLPYWMVQARELNKIDSREEGSEILHRTFNEVYDHFYFDHWFDEEIKKLTGIDIFEYPFNKEHGVQTIREGKYEILLLKLEKLDTALDEIYNFVGYPFEIQQKNLSERKWYSSAYKDFQKEYHPSKAYLQSLYNTKTARHFYSKYELDNFEKMFE